MKESFIEIAVIATMSAGKSTLVNSLLGAELMLSANEATTAKVTVIEQENELDKYYGSVEHRKKGLIGPSVISTELLKSWNSDNDVIGIFLKGRFQNITLLSKPIRIYDTPGPNNSQDSRHQQILEAFISEKKLDLILYVINATQIGINDDKDLLKKILKNKRNVGNIIFIINKIDVLDSERGETIQSVAEKVRRYLKKNGFGHKHLKNIVCMSSETVLVASKYLNNERLTRSERHALMRLVNADSKKEVITYQQLDSFSQKNKKDVFIKIIRDSGILDLNLKLLNLFARKGKSK